MGAEHPDIFSNVSRSGGTTSSGALAAYLIRSCGHVLVTSRIIQQGYKFHSAISDEIPAFFNKRISTGSTNVSITLQGGFDPESKWQDDPFEGCKTASEAKTVIESSDNHSSLWIAKITVGSQMIDVKDVSAPIFLAKHPNEFRVIAEELVALGILQDHSCPMCSEPRIGTNFD